MAEETKAFVPAGVTDDLRGIRYPARAEVKHDGVRLYAEIDADGAVTLKSKTGRPYDLPTVKAAVEELYITSAILDGEFVAGTFEETLSVIQGGLPDTCGRFRIFDCVNMLANPGGLSRRRMELVQLSLGLREDGALALAEGGIVNNKHEMRAFFRSVTRAGGEGIVIKNLDAPYGERGAWVRLKTARTYDGVVVDTVEGKGKWAGMLGALVVEIDGVRSKVVNGFYTDQRKKLWQERESLVGRWVEVGANELTAAGRLRGQHTVRFREDKE